ncbi:hypothetical protein SO802_005798 [Lithocarpus litseifolius]|uniref:Uncharacterized protein n=1 Tax=Lithocarpus litseifolius TaxID=425828 RepID=A0AAW2DNC3_9ROSI
MISLIGGSIDPTKGHVLNLITQGSDILKDKLHIHEGLAKSLIKAMTTTFFSSKFDTSCKLHSIASASAPPGQQQECFFFPTTIPAAWISTAVSQFMGWTFDSFPLAESSKFRKRISFMIGTVLCVAAIANGVMLAFHNRNVEYTGCNGSNGHVVVRILDHWEWL